LKETQRLSEKNVKRLLHIAKQTDDHEWEILSYLVATGKRTSKIADTFGLSPRKIEKICKKYSDKLGFELTPHMFRRLYALRLQLLGVKPSVIEKLLGHKPPFS
jgi:integrase